jgi:hypothetical protein
VNRIEKAVATTFTHASQSAESSAQLNAEALHLNHLADRLATAMYGNVTRGKDQGIELTHT